MTLLRTLLAAVVAASLTSAPALADRPRDRAPRAESNRPPRAESNRPPRGDSSGPVREQQRAFEATREGRSMPLPQLERRVMPFMGGADYLGPEFNGGTYRLKFMQNGRVIWVDVDAATGRIIGRSGR
jgi:hypothetical protein